MQAVKGERLQQFLEGRLPHEGRRLSSLVMTEREERGKHSLQLQQLKNAQRYSFLPFNRNICYT